MIQIQGYSNLGDDSLERMDLALSLLETLEACWSSTMYQSKVLKRMERL